MSMLLICILKASAKTEQGLENNKPSPYLSKKYKRVGTAPHILYIPAMSYND